MTKKEFKSILKVLEQIKNPDAHVNECIHLVKRDLERYEKTRGQLREQWDGYQI